MESYKKQFEIYERLLLEWNEKINLTAITEHEQIAVRHFEDSMTLLDNVDIPQGSSVIDVGTGAGFPGMVLKIARPDLNVTLLDGHKKRFLFLEQLQNELGIYCENVHRRAEEAKELRERFYLATARAVARLNILCEYCLPFVMVGGLFVAMKGSDISEVDEAEHAIKTLGGQLADIKNLKLSDGSERNLIIIKKISQTPLKYPRISAKISKQPL